MKKRTSNLYILLVLLAVVIVVVLFFGFSGREGEAIQSEGRSPAEEVIENYFVGWDNKDYGVMYGAISDGFKRIDPEAKDVDSFIRYASSQGINGVMIISIKEVSNNGRTASVDYSVEFKLDDGSYVPFSDTYTLRYRKNDVVEGWKMIHPYGENIDTS